MLDLILITLVFCAAAGLYRWKAPIFGALRRFDARNAARRSAELQERYDALAHYRHTLRLAGEQVEQITEVTVSDPHTGRPVRRFLFEGKEYGERSEAEDARYAAMVAIAREFYRDLDTLFLNRGSARRRERPMGALSSDNGNSKT